MDLTKGQIKALGMIGFGVVCRTDGYYSEDDGERLDERSAKALIRRGLAICTYGLLPGGFGGRLDLTELGEEEFERRLANGEYNQWPWYER